MERLARKKLHHEQNHGVQIGEEFHSRRGDDNTREHSYERRRTVAVGKRDDHDDDDDDRHNQGEVRMEDDSRSRHSDETQQQHGSGDASTHQQSVEEAGVEHRRSMGLVQAPRPQAVVTTPTTAVGKRVNTPQVQTSKTASHSARQEGNSREATRSGGDDPGGLPKIGYWATAPSLNEIRRLVSECMYVCVYICMYV